MTRSVRNLSFAWLWLLVSLVSFSSPAAAAQPLAGASLIDELRQGGYVLVMRHANSPAMPPEKAQADPENVKLERQLDTAGRDAARAMGEAFKRLRIPLGEVLSSPTFRALQTIKLASFGAPKTFAELDEGAQGMQASADQARIAWLRSKIAEIPRVGTNTLIVTHAPNIAGAFGIDAAAGETLLFRPDGKSSASQLARVKIQDWATLAK